jgi:hypothetical protein
MDFGAASAGAAASAAGAAVAAAAGAATTGATTSFANGAGAGFADCAITNDGMAIAAKTTSNFFNIFIYLAPYPWCGAENLRMSCSPVGGRTCATYSRANPNPQAVDLIFLAFKYVTFLPICVAIR